MPETLRTSITILLVPFETMSAEYVSLRASFFSAMSDDLNERASPRLPCLQGRHRHRENLRLVARKGQQKGPFSAVRILLPLANQQCHRPNYLYNGSNHRIDCDLSKV